MRTPKDGSGDEQVGWGSGMARAVGDNESPNAAPYTA
jgi:hypothetical protein